MRPFRKVLIANRGEVALRVQRACSALGIASVAVYSDADRRSLHVTQADEAFRLGGTTAAESYLDQDRLLDVLRSSGADAVHPGFGFLAENADFAAAVSAAGACFIGPSVEAIRCMASKAAARRLAKSLGIEIIPGDDGEDQDVVRLTRAAAAVGYPLLIKAAAGGGGMGIRMVRTPCQFVSALESAKQEAQAAFGDRRVVLERCFEDVRHVEVQVVGDAYGKVLHCFDRECSLQRRRQKVIEEAPAFGLGEAARRTMTDAALAIARSVNYTGLGTVEFLFDVAAERCYFLEMNTRLQVEHAITESVTGLDLVQMQIQIAEGRPLEIAQDDIRVRGHAIECRLYAEDPSEDFAPSTGRLLHWRAEANDGLRVDTGVATGATVSSFYDPMLAKLIAHAADRTTAIRKLLHGLGRLQALGPATNQAFLAKLLDHPAYRAGRLTTTFIDRHRTELFEPADDATLRRAALIAAVHRFRLRHGADAHPPPTRTYHLCAQSLAGSFRVAPAVGDRYRVEQGPHVFDVEVLACEERDPAIVIDVDGHSSCHAVIALGEVTHVSMGLQGAVRVEFVPRLASRGHRNVAGHYRAAMTGRVLDVAVSPGSRVARGQRLVVLESMKMEHVTVATDDGVVRRLLTQAGAIVEKDAVLIEIDADETGGDATRMANDGQ